MLDRSVPALPWPSLLLGLVLEPVHLGGGGGRGRRGGKLKKCSYNYVNRCHILPLSLPFLSLSSPPPPPILSSPLPLHLLNMDVRVDRGNKDIWNKVVFDPGVHLDNVPTLPPHIQVVDNSSLQILRSLTDSKCVAPAHKKMWHNLV